MTTAQAEYDARRELERTRKRGRTRQAIPQDVLVAKLFGHRCRLCDAAGVEAHHLVPRSKWRTGDAAVNDPDNVIPLCHLHHQDHHTTTKRIPRSVLTAEEATFVITHTTPAWADTWYPA